MLNPQRQYGADVVERGNYVLKHGPEQLYSLYPPGGQ